MVLSYLVILFILLFSVFLGIAINYIADYLIMQNLKKQLVCDYCGKPKGFILEYILMQRRCTYCGAYFSQRIVLIPILSLLLAIVLLLFKISWMKWTVVWIIWIYCCLIFIIDWEIKKIFWVLLKVGIILMALFGVISHGLAPTFWGGVISTLIFLVLYIGGLFYKNHFYKNIVVKNLPFSMNDIFLAGCLGLVLGIHLVFQGLVLSLLFTCVLVLSKTMLMLIKHTYNPTTPIPIGSMLCLGAFLVILLSVLGYKQFCLLNFCMTFAEPSSPFAIFP